MENKRNIISIEEINDLIDELDVDPNPTGVPKLESDSVPKLESHDEESHNEEPQVEEPHIDKRLPEVPFDSYPSDTITLKDFISRIKVQIKKEDPIVKNIADKDLLVIGLEELDGLIGHDQIKSDVVDQVMYAINHLNTPKEERTPVMLHTILYGDPGVGKTAVGKKLAIIWKGLGFLNDEKPTIQDQMNSVSKMSWEEWFIVAYVIFLAISFLFLAFSYAKDGYNKVYQYTGIWGVCFCLLVFLIIAAFLWYYWPNENSNTTTDEETGKKHRKKDDELITVVSREDLVSKYLGGTDKKTKELLERNRGKVVFIDEAYSLIQNDAHEYGKEAVDVINRYMSEYPDRSIIIFAGYEKKMKRSIFSYQPGLESRCMWKFSCKNYNATQLYNIFVKQLDDIGWKISPWSQDHTKNEIKMNKKYFKAQARDTERLRLYAQMAHNRRSMFHKTTPKTLDMLDIKAGIDKLKENTFNKTKKPKRERTNLSELIRRTISSRRSDKDDSDVEGSDSDSDVDLL